MCGKQCSQHEAKHGEHLCALSLLFAPESLELRLVIARDGEQGTTWQSLINGVGMSRAILKISVDRPLRPA